MINITTSDGVMNMSLTADTADAIVNLDEALAVFDRALGHVADEYPEYEDLKAAIQRLQEVACGEGMHFDSLGEARAYRNVTDHMYTGTDRYSCSFVYGRVHQCAKNPSQHTVVVTGYHRCMDCERPIPTGPGQGARCGDCMDPSGAA